MTVYNHGVIMRVCETWPITAPPKMASPIQLFFFFQQSNGVSFCLFHTLFTERYENVRVLIVLNTWHMCNFDVIIMPCFRRCMCVCCCCCFFFLLQIANKMLFPKMTTLFSPKSFLNWWHINKTNLFVRIFS